MFDPDDLRAIYAAALTERLDAGREPIGDPPPDDTTRMTRARSDRA
jgi:hypothetical protein